MDVDHNIPDDHDGGAKRRLEEPSPTKVRVVSGPQRESYDHAKEMEAYHKEQASVARQKNTQLATENQQIIARLQAAEKVEAEYAAHVKSLQRELQSKGQLIADMQRHEGELESQFLGDQARLQELFNNCNALVPQILESQKLLAQRNDDVEKLNRLLLQKKDEAIQLRAYNYLQGKKNTPQTKPPPRRGTRASLDFVHHSSTRIIEIPLDPIPIARAPKGKANPKPKKLAATPEMANFFGTDVDTLNDFITKFERLVVDNDATITVEGMTPKKRNGEKFKPLAKSLVTYIHTALRIATYTKFEVNQANDFSIYNPVEEHKVAACEEDFIDPPDDLFQWDFSPGYGQSRWNKLMIQKIVDAALESDGDRGPIAMAGVDRGYLEKLMREKLKRYHTGWKAFQPRFSEELGRIETMREAKVRGTEAYEQHRLAARSNSSKHRKYEDHIKTITAAIEFKTDDDLAVDIPTWERLRGMIELLGEQGMSSEEEDQLESKGNVAFVYRVKICVWREPRIVDYLRLVDKQSTLLKKRQRGAPIHSRIRTGVPGSSKVPRGLPRSLYNGDWLEKATPAYVENLKISKEAFELFVAAVDRMAV